MKHIEIGAVESIRLKSAAPVEPAEHDAFIGQRTTLRIGHAARYHAALFELEIDVFDVLAFRHVECFALQTRRVGGNEPRSQRKDQVSASRDARYVVVPAL